MQAGRTLIGLMTFLGILLLAGCGKPASEESVPAAAGDATAVPAALPRSSSPAGADLFFISPDDGAIVSNPFRIEFGIAGMRVVKAGEAGADTGHHHLLIDTDIPDLGLPVPADEQHRHFGDASTSTELTLGAGQHTLQLLFADHAHIPHNPPLISGPITITVE